MEEARRTYEILNTELHDELPALYDSRILFLVTNLQTLFATEQVFHNETAKVGGLITRLHVLYTIYLLLLFARSIRNLRLLLTSWPQNRNAAPIRCANRQVGRPITIQLFPYLSYIYLFVDLCSKRHQDFESSAIASEQTEQRQCEQQQLSESDHHKRWLQSGQQS